MRFDDLIYLDNHLSFVAQRLAGAHTFVVGGAVRDILLGINLEPQDIDITLADEPDNIYKKLQKSLTDDTSLFRTEKYGTVTLIQKSQITNHKAQSNEVIQNSKSKMQNNSVTQEYVYELTPFREEGGYADHRHPDEITRSTSLLDDAKRRDFTINCIYYSKLGILHSKGNKEESEIIQNSKSKIQNNAEHGESSIENVLESLAKQGRYYIQKQGLLIIQDHELIEKFFAEGKIHEKKLLAWMDEQNADVGETVRFLIDPFGGLQDLTTGTLRCVGEAENRFHEDALRILRGVRLVNTINQKLPLGNFDFEKETWKAMKNLHPLVTGLAKERLHQEIVKVFMGNNPFGWVAVIDELGLLPYLFPALYKNKHDDQPIRYHPFDTYSHILLTLRHLQQINSDYLVKLAMLYHDVGKKDQYAEYAKATTKEEMQEIHSSPMNHVISGPVFVQADFRALGFSNKEIDEIALYVGDHMKPGQILMARPDNQIKRMRQLLSEHGYERTKNLLDITVADRRGQYNPLQANEINAVQVLYDILEKLYKDEGQFTLRDLAINGDDVIAEFHLIPGPEIKQKLQQAFERVSADIQQRNTKESVIAHLHSLDH